MDANQPGTGNAIRDPRSAIRNNLRESAFVRGNCMKRLLLILALLLAASGCASWEVIGPENTRLKEDGFEVDLPAGWVRAMFERDQIILTHEGLPLQQIMVRSRPNKKAFPKLKKPADDKLLPSELAEMQVAETKRTGQVESNLEVLENEPATIAGRLGFKVRLRFVTPRGLPMEQLLYGFCDDKHYYLLGLQAPGLYYFDAHRGEFERMVASFKLAQS